MFLEDPAEIERVIVAEYFCDFADIVTGRLQQDLRVCDADGQDISSLTALITKNENERVQMGAIRFIFAFATSLLIQSVTVKAVATSLLIQSVTVKAVAMMGGGAQGWRTVAIVYAVIGLIVNTISVFSVKELPEEETEEVLSEVSDKVSDKKEPESCIRMLYFMYLWIPMIINLVITLLLSRMKVEQANARLKGR